MKTPLLTFSSLFLLVAILFSCSEEEDLVCRDINTKENSTINLVRITSDYYNDENLYSSSITKFLDGKPVTIQYSDESYDSMIYQEDMIFEILEFDSEKNLEWRTTYEYDYFDRLTLKALSPGPSNNITNVSQQKSFIYNEGLIESKNSWSDDGFHKNTIILNNERQIVEDILFNSEDLLLSRRTFEYNDGNLTKQIIEVFEDEVTFEQTFTYLEETASKAYRYNEFLFGDEWKINCSLNKQFGLGQFNCYEVSEDYIAEYNSYSFTTGVSSTNTFSYEFDTDGKITKQTENISSSTGDNYKVVKKYFYE